MNAIDTNILVYAFDKSDSKKRETCKKIFQDIMEGRKEGAVTNQILAEFAYVVTTKVKKPLDRKEVAAIIGTINNSANWTILNYDSEIVLNALETKKKFWDALIIQTLRKNNINKIITENISDFKGSGLEVSNPL